MNRASHGWNTDEKQMEIGSFSLSVFHPIFPICNSLHPCASSTDQRSQSERACLSKRSGHAQREMRAEARAPTFPAGRAYGSVNGTPSLRQQRLVQTAGSIT